MTRAADDRRGAKKIRAGWLSLLACLALAACNQESPAASATQGTAAQPAGPARYTYRVVAAYPHDPEAFTQGLLYLDGALYESTGLIGQSTIRRVRLEDGQVLQSVDLPDGQFGEGIVDWGDQLINVSWQDGVGYRWDRRTLRRLDEWHYPGEGWGLTRNGGEIIMSDGTAQLRFLDPEELTEKRRLDVTLEGRPLALLNELEWVNGEIFANVWTTAAIVRIDPATGHVTGIIDLSPLAAMNGAGGGENVLNGIAYDAAGDRLFVTGKNWPRLYEIDLVRQD